jgi:hypothetical protein
LRSALIEVQGYAKQELYDQMAQARHGTEVLWAIGLGMFLFVLFSDVGYMMFAYGTLKDLSTAVAKSTRILPGSQVVAWAAVLGGMVLLLILLAKSVGILRLGIVKLTMLCGAFVLVAVGVMTVFPKVEPVAVTVAFGLVVLVVTWLGGDERDVSAPSNNGSRTYDLSREHEANANFLTLEVLCLGLAVAVIVLAWFAGALPMVWPKFIPEWKGVGPKQIIDDVAESVGLVIFAFIGMGIYNLARYPRLFEKRERKDGSRSKSTTYLRHTVRWGTIVPSIIFVAWSIVACFSIEPGRLGRENISLLAIVDRLDEIGGTSWISVIAQAVLLLAGNLFAFLAIVSAYHGSTDTLVDRCVLIAKRRGWMPGRPGGRRDTQHWMRLVIRGLIVVSTALASGMVLRFGWTGMASVVSLAGAVGGGLLFIYLPRHLVVVREQLSGSARLKYYSLIVVPASLWSMVYFLQFVFLCASIAIGEARSVEDGLKVTVLGAALLAAVFVGAKAATSAMRMGPDAR